MSNSPESTSPKNNTSTLLVSFLSIALFFIWSIFHASFIFQQFTLLEIISASSFSLLLLVSFSVLFMRESFRHINFKLSFTDVFLAVIALVIMVFLANSLTEHYLNYYRPIPYLEIELGLGWHKDTAFHVSIIQNILNFGYPSIGQHDTPIIVYHVLSHYVDALGVLLTGLDPYDSYTLFFHFKIFLFISSIMLLVSTTLKSTKPTISILAFLVLAPVAISYWYPIGSEGLWFISIVTIFSIPKVFSIMTKETSLQNKDYFYIFILIIVISLGKVSSGFMFAAFIGVYLLLSNFKDYRVYLLGILWSVFFLTFMNLMSGSDGSSSLSTPNVFDIQSLIDRIKIYSKFTGIQVLQILISTCILFLLSFFYKSKKAYLTVISALAALTIFFIITQIYTGFNRGVVLYFSFGLSFVITLVTFLFVSKYLNSGSSIYLDKIDKSNKNTRKIFFVLIITGLTFFYAKPSSNLFSINFTQTKKVINNINQLSYMRINTTLAINKKISFKRLLLGQVEFDIPKKPSTSLATFKRNLEAYAQDNHLSKKDSLLYLPKNIFESNITQLHGPTWASGMLIYASTGFPLAHGIQTLRIDHGYADYDNNSLWKKLEKFDSDLTSKFTKNIIVVKSFSPAKFSHIKYQQKSSLLQRQLVMLNFEL